MAADDGSGARPPVVLRIKLRYEDLDTMVQKFAPNVGRSGLFLPTRSMQPIGTDVKFELRLATDVPVLVGLGRVKHVRPPDPTNPKASCGLAVELQRVTRESREVIIRMIEQRRALGLPEVAIPLPELAKRAPATNDDVETNPRAETSGIVREAMAQLASAPVSEQILTPPQRPSQPLAVAVAVAVPAAAAVAAAVPVPAAVPEPVFRSTSSVPVPAPLTAEPTRTKRPRIHDLIAKAHELSGPLAAVPVPGIDDASIDVAHVLARARSLARSGAGDLDAELSALADASAAPVEISIEAASAELARQLGGAGVAKRERSARWQPPPAVAMRTETAPVPMLERAPAAPTPITMPEPSVLVDVVSGAKTAPILAAPVEPGAEMVSDTISPPEAVAEAVAVAEPVPSSYVEPATETHATLSASGTVVLAPEPAATEVLPLAPTSEVVAAGMLIDDNADVRSFERALTPDPTATLASPSDDDEDIAELDADDLEAVEESGEHTQIGQAPVDPEAFSAHAYETVPSHEPAELAERLEQQLVAAEAEADAELSDIGAPAYSLPPEHLDEEAGSPEEISDLDVVDEADANAEIDALPADSLAEVLAQVGVDFENDPHRLPAASDDLGTHDALAHGSRGSPLDGLDDGEDPDDLSLPAEPAPPPEPAPQRHYDFSAQLDLDDEADVFDSPHAFDADARAAHAHLQSQHQQRHARAPEYLDEPDDDDDLAINSVPRADSVNDPPSGGYTVAEPSYPRAAIDFDDPHAFAAPDLESALDQLDDVDLEDVERRSRPHLPGLPQEHYSAPTRVARPKQEPATESARPRKPQPQPQPPSQAKAHPRTQPRPTGPSPIDRPTQSGRPAQAPAKPASRRAMSEDDGILIDFDDDE